MITYTITMPVPDTHLYHVEVEIDAVAGPTLDLVLPAWTPGSYMIREYARHVQEFAAAGADGSPLPWRKVAKDTWRVTTAGAGAIRATYKVYANELTVRTSHLDASHGYFNSACVCMYTPGRTSEPLLVRVGAPAGWQVTTALPEYQDKGTGGQGDKGIALTPQPPLPLGKGESDLPAPAGSGAGGEGDLPSFLAADYDELVDSPFECGTHRLLHFSVDGIAHRIAIWGRGNEDEARLLADTRRIVEAQRDLFGGLPYPHYTFILHLTDGRGGGLEHRNSVTNQVDRWTFRPERSYERYLSLTSHELFHVWNVKRLRPAPLGPFDYQRENYTRLLWLMEGATSYYDELLLVRAGLVKPDRYIEKLADEILTLQSQPGRRIQSLEQSSFDAWIKFYRPDENSANTSISYYLKGSLVCLLLDMEIRRLTGGERSFDDLLRHLYAAYPHSGPGIPEDGAMLAAIEAIAGHHGGAFQTFLNRYVAGLDELNYPAAFAVVGLEPRWGHRKPGPNGAAPAWLGVTFKRQGERTLIAAARSDGPAYAAGVYADDELLAIDGWRVNEDRLNARIAERAPGDTVRLSLFRGDRLIELPVTLAAAPPDALEFAPVPGASAQQLAAYRAWLGITAK